MANFRGKEAARVLAVHHPNNVEQQPARTNNNQQQHQQQPETTAAVAFIKNLLQIFTHEVFIAA